MKSTLLTLVAVLALSFTVQGQIVIPNGGIAKLAIVHNPVFIERKGKRTKVGMFGTVVQPNDVILTGEGGLAQVSLETGDEIFIAPQSQVTLIEKHEETSSENQGGFWVSVVGKIRATIQKSKQKRMIIKTANATIGVKGTVFVVEYIHNQTSVGTLEGLVEVTSLVTNASLDVPVGKMTSIPINGEILPLTEVTGELLKDVEISGKPMESKDIGGLQM